MRPDPTPGSGLIFLTMTETEIANLALSKLGASLIIRMGDASIPESHNAGILYQPTLERVLRDHQWSFAEREEALALLPTAESRNWSYTYKLPANFARLVSIQSNTRGIPERNFHRTGFKLHCDVSPVFVHYIRKDVLPDEFDPDFREAFVTLLASELAKPILQSPEMKAQLFQEYTQVALPRAKATDAKETDSNENHGPYQAILNSPLNQARFGGRASTRGENYPPLTETVSVPDLDQIAEEGLP